MTTAMAVLGVVGCASSPQAPGIAGAQAQAVAAEEKEEYYPSFEERTAKLRLGMSRARVTAIMDDEGRSVSKSLSGQGQIETVMYAPDFGQRYSTALRRQFSMGFAGMSDPNGAVLTFRNGTLTHVNTH